MIKMESGGALTTKEASIALRSVLLAKAGGVDGDKLALALLLEDVEVGLKDGVGSLDRSLLPQEPEVEDEVGKKAEERRVEPRATTQVSIPGPSIVDRVKTHSAEMLSRSPGSEAANWLKSSSVRPRMTWVMAIR